MASTNNTIHLDLDTAERPADQVHEPFTFNWKGRAITLSDPAEIDWRELLEIESPVGFLRYTATQEDREFLRSDAGKMEGWRIGVLMEGYYKHFGLDKNKSADKLGF